MQGIFSISHDALFSQGQRKQWLCQEKNGPIFPTDNLMGGNNLLRDFLHDYFFLIPQGVKSYFSYLHFFGSFSAAQFILINSRWLLTLAPSNLASSLNLLHTLIPSLLAHCKRARQPNERTS